MIFDCFLEILKTFDISMTTFFSINITMICVKIKQVIKMEKLRAIVCLFFLIGCENSVELDVIEGEVTGTVFDDSTNVPIDSVEVYITTSSVSHYQGQYYFGQVRICSSITNEKGCYLLVANIKRDKQYYLCAKKSGYESINQYTYCKSIVLSFKNYQSIDIRLKKH